MPTCGALEVRRVLSLEDAWKAWAKLEEIEPKRPEDHALGSACLERSHFGQT
jgi:hypothetical protein